MGGLIYLTFLNLLYHVEIVLGNVASENSARVVFRGDDQKNVTNIGGPIVLSHFVLF